MFYATKKSLSTQNWLCMHICNLIDMNIWCRLYYAYNLELLWYGPRHVCWHAISFFTCPFLWHSPLVTSQNDSHNTTTSVSEFLCIHYQYMQTVQKNTSTNENIFFAPIMDFGEVWIDQQFLALSSSLLWILRPSWNVHFSQHPGWLPDCLGLSHPLATMLHIHVFKKTIRDMSERYGWHSHLSD